MLVIGLDLSIRSSGCVALPHTFAATRDWSTVRHRLVLTDSMPQGASVRERTGRLVAAAIQIADWCKGLEPDVIAIEEQAFSRVMSYARETAEMHAHVKRELLDAKCSLVMVVAGAARKTLLGAVTRPPPDQKGLSAKQRVELTLARMHAPWTGNDRSDAFATANHALSMLGYPAVTVGEW